jgi:hypothetical protein
MNLQNPVKCFALVLLIGGVALLLRTEYGGSGRMGAAKSKLSAARRQAMRTKEISDKAVLARVQEQESAGDLDGAEAGYLSLIDDRASFERNVARYRYGKLLIHKGQDEKALSVLKPTVITGVKSSWFDAVQLYEATLRRTGGNDAVRAFRDEIRDNSLDGFSLRYYNEQGLTDDQAMNFIAAGWAAGRQHYAEAEPLLKKVIADHPNYFQVYDDMMEVLFKLNRGDEVKPMYADWYRHAPPEVRQWMKKHYFLDYKRLDAERNP